RVGAVGAQRAGRVGNAAPHGLELMMPQPTQKYVLVAALEFGQRPAQSILGPALRVRLFRVREEAIESGEEFGDEIGEPVVLREARRFANNEVVAMGERFPDQSNGVRIKFTALQRVQRRHLLVESAMRHSFSWTAKDDSIYSVGRRIPTV